MDIFLYANCSLNMKLGIIVFVLPETELRNTMWKFALCICSSNSYFYFVLPSLIYLSLYFELTLHVVSAFSDRLP